MDVYHSSLKGLREQNEDRHTIIKNLKGSNNSISKINFFAIYDGHGGKEISDFLSKNLPQYFIKKNLEYPISKKYIKEVYNHIQNLLRIKHKNIAYRQGSTCLSLIQYIKNGSVWLNIINTGDSRAVICRNNFAHPLTKDHKPNWPEEKSRIEKLGGKIYLDGPDYRIGDLSVSRSFGDISSMPYVTHVPDIFKVKLDKTDDKFIILACDGLWDKVESHDAVNFVLSYCYDSTLTKRINKTTNIAELLAQYALKKHSTDNVSVIVIFFHK